jgi:hypothetical protein
MIELTYDKFRKIMALSVKNETIKKTVKELFDGRVKTINETMVLELLVDAEIDMEVYEILTGKKAAKADAIDVVEAIADFFGYMLSKKKQLKGLLSNLGFQVASPASDNGATA